MGKNLSFELHFECMVPRYELHIRTKATIIVRMTQKWARKKKETKVPLFFLALTMLVS